MSLNIRQQQLLDILEKRGYVTVRDLVNTLHYSSATINRDLNKMQTQGLLKRSYGGVEPVKRGSLPPFPQRQYYMKKEKRRIARQAAALIQNGDRIFLDASTTVQHILPFLSEKKELMILTNNLRLAIDLSDFDFDVICLGGLVTERPYVLNSEDTIEIAQKYRVDKMFFSVDCITMDGHIHSTQHLLYKTVLRNSDEAYFLTDKTKLVEKVDKILCDFSAVTGVISDFEFPPDTCAAYPNTKFILAKD